MFDQRYEQLDAAFLRTMNEIGQHGHITYGPLPNTRAEHLVPARVSPEQNAAHACTHFGHYLNGVPHDYFETRRHQLAAVAFNAMMEFRFFMAEGGDRLCTDETCERHGTPAVAERAK